MEVWGEASSFLSPCPLFIFVPWSQIGVDLSTAFFSLRVQVRAVKLIPEEFSLENRLLTPTMKCARHVIRKHYQEELRQLFARKELD